MWDSILQLAISDGLWALLFCTLLIYQLKDSKTREAKYQSTISSLAQDLEYMKELDESIENMEQSFKEYAETMMREVCGDSQTADKVEIRQSELAKENV